MKKRIAVTLMALLASGAVLAFTGKSWSETQALSRAAPTLATEGMNLNGVVGYQVTISAPVGQTITGGTLQCYFMSTLTARWARCPASFDLTPSTAVRDWTSPSFTVVVGMGRLLYAATSITISAGSTVVVGLEARASQ